MTKQINITDFDNLDIRIGQIIKAEVFPEARNPSYKLWVDLGILGIKKSSAQITQLYTTDKLVGKYIVTIANLPPRNIAGFTSEILVLGVVSDNGDCVLLMPDRAVQPGQKVS